jgi:hypothetical protein
MSLIEGDPCRDGDDRYWYAVEVRSHAAPVTGNLGAWIGGLCLRAVEFEVPVDEGDVAQSSASDLARAGRYAAARDGAGAVAAGTDWPAGKYLVTVRGTVSASTYVADIDQYRSYSLHPFDLRICVERPEDGQ